jgi:tRNA threonylcarbamoyladenosine biosynthesis protein TsaB
LAYLIIDTSASHGSVAVWAEGELRRVVSWSSRHNHTSDLMPSVERVVGDSGLTVADIAGIAVATGPGGFSALRAGLGAAKGLSFATGAPVVGLSTLEGTAYPYRSLGFPVCAMIGAGRDLVGFARFRLLDGRWMRRSPDRVSPVARVLAASGRHTLFCGEGAATYAAELTEAMGSRAHVAGDEPSLARLRGLAELGAARLDAGDVDAIAALQPHYLRPPGITPPKRPLSVRYGAAPKAR